MSDLTKRTIRSARTQRRGVAMLLVILALTMATILSVSYLASRDKSAAIGANIASAAMARWASQSGIDYGVSILQTETDWRTDHIGGKLIDDMPLGDAEVDLDLKDAVTSGPPSEKTEYVEMTSTATSDGVESVSIAIAFVPLDYGDVATVDLSDFAVFTTDTISLNDDSIITRWSSSPESALTPGIAVGTQSVAASAITIDDNASMVDTSVLYGPGASPYLVSVTNDTTVQEVQLLDQIPIPVPPTYPVDTTPSASTAFNAVAPTTVNADARFTTVDIAATNDQVTLQGPMTLVSESDLTVNANTGLLIEGDVTLVVLDDLIMRGQSFIELAPGATLKMFVSGDFDLLTGYIGDQRPDHNVYDTSGAAPYMDPQRVQITGDTTAKVWSLKGFSLIKGSIYLPNSTQTIEGASAIYGRVTAHSLELSQNAALFYDPALDSGNGFATPQSRVYDAAGNIRPEFLSLAKLDDADLTTLAINENLLILAKGEAYGTPPADPPATPPHLATPRPVPVEWTMVSTGLDSTSWEERGTQYSAPPDPIEKEARDLATYINTMNQSNLTGFTAMQMLARRNEMVASANNAAGAVDAVYYDTAISHLQVVLSRVDGIPAVLDYMNAGAARDYVRAEATRMIAELQAR